MGQDIASLLEWHRLNRRDFPWRHAGVSPFHVLVAEVLLRRTAARKVSSVFSRIVTQYPRPYDLSRAKRSELKRLLYPLGLTSRTEYLRALGSEIERRGEALTDMAAIVGLPLVGDYTAKATALTLGTGSEIPLDTNILRITKRMWGNMSSGELTKRLNIWAADNVREVFFALIDLGAFVCRPTNPKCSTCPISISCVNRRRLDT